MGNDKCGVIVKHFFHDILPNIAQYDLTKLSKNKTNLWWTRRPACRAECRRRCGCRTPPARFDPPQPAAWPTAGQITHSHDYSATNRKVYGSITGRILLKEKIKNARLLSYHKCMVLMKNGAYKLRKVLHTFKR